jgi:uncharacterized protein (DUF58 family)
VTNFLKNTFLTPRFAWASGLVVALLALGFGWPPLFYFGQIALAGLVVLLLYNAFQLYHPWQSFQVARKLPKIGSLGDQQKVEIRMTHLSTSAFSYTLMDELPVQLQERDFQIQGKETGKGSIQLNYTIRPLSRGIYIFGNLHLLLRVWPGLLFRRYTFLAEAHLPVYPSIIQMKQYALFSPPRLNKYLGIKKVRRIGHSYEFEQIKNYVRGDDYRSINWKSTSRFNDLMINQFQDEKSQAVYCVLDKSRLMRMPFEGLTLLDYSINAALIISNMVLQKTDKAGLITFREQVDSIMRADGGPRQLRRIYEALYRESESTGEAHYEKLYATIRKAIPNRSLLFLFTNIESLNTAQRRLPLFKKLAKSHLLVPIIFENTPLLHYGDAFADDERDVYLKTAARQLALEKRQVAQVMRQQGLSVILTKPEDLNSQVINKYLEFKSRGLI